MQETPLENSVRPIKSISLKPPPRIREPKSKPFIGRLLALALLSTLALTIYLTREHWSADMNADQPSFSSEALPIATSDERSKTISRLEVTKNQLPLEQATQSSAGDFSEAVVVFEQEPSGEPERTDSFSGAMAKGIIALNQQNYRVARSAFQRALVAEPNSTAGRDGLAQAEIGLTMAQIRNLEEEAKFLEADESWEEAIQKYKAILALDEHQGSAKQALDHAVAMNKIHHSLQFYTNLPERMSTKAVLEEARALTDQIDQLEGPGPKMERRAQHLKSLVKVYETPVRVLFESDNETQVMVAKIGKLGAFEQKVLDLRPGKYVVMGSRTGFRDVRRQLIIKPGQAPEEPIRIRCEEKI